MGRKDIYSQCNRVLWKIQVKRENLKSSVLARDEAEKVSRGQITSLEFIQSH